MDVSVLGAGAGGLAAVVELVGAGHRVRLWNRSAATLARHVRDGLVVHSGVLGVGAVRPDLVTTDLRSALDGADVALVVLPAVVHDALLADLAALPCTVPLVLLPGHTGGALRARAVFAAAGAALPPTAEVSTLAWVARVGQDGVVDVTGRAGRVRAAALPGGLAALDATVALLGADGAVTRETDVLATSLADVNLVLHPPGAVLAAAWVEATGGAFRFYVEGMGEAVGRVAAALDAERLAVAADLGHRLDPLVVEMAGIGTVPEPLARAAVEAAGGTDPGPALATAVRSGVANSRIGAPDGFAHRYYREDLPYGLLPFVALADLAGRPVPVAQSLLVLGATLTGEDPAAVGRTAERLGIAGLDRAGLRAVVGAAA